MDPPGELGIVGRQFLDYLACRVKAVYPEPSRLPLQGACGVFIEICRMFHRGYNLRANEISVSAVPDACHADGRINRRANNGLVDLAHLLSSSKSSGNTAGTHNEEESVVKFACVHAMTWPAGRSLPRDGGLCGRGHPCDVPPGQDALTHLLAIPWGREPVAPRAGVGRDGTIGRQKPLGVPWGFEPTHASFPLSGGLV